MLGLFLCGSVLSALKSGECDSIEDYCNQNGCNYDDVYYEKEVSEDDDWTDNFVGWAD